MARPALRLTDATSVLVLTGAGVSAESGLPTFRGQGGLWEKQKVEELSLGGPALRGKMSRMAFLILRGR